MVAFADLIKLPTAAEVKAKVLVFATELGLPITSWIPGDPSERWTDIIPRALDAFLSNFTTQQARAFFLELATDPGDAGDFSPDQTPRPGVLSALGAGWYGVERGQATKARVPLKLTNIGLKPATIRPYDLTQQRSTEGPDGGFPTYRNVADTSVYTGPGGTLTILPGATATIPIVAEQSGTVANAAPGEISIVVTNSFGSFSCTNETPALGSDREDRALYIARCRLQSGAASPNGAADAYRYASTTGADGKPLQLWDGSGATTVNRVFVSPDSSTGEVLIYLANPAGAASTVEVSSANANINGLVIADASGVVWNPKPIGVVPDAIVLGPTAVDTKTQAPGPGKAIETSYGFLAGTARIREVPGVASVALVAAVHSAAELAVSLYFEDLPIGGLDQVAGAGTVYRNDVEKAWGASYSGLYAVNLTKPSSVTMPLTLGHVATYPGSPKVTAAGAGDFSRVRLTVDQNLTGLAQVQIWEAVTDSLDLLGIWDFAWIDATHIDLIGSVWGGTFTSCSLSCVIVTVVP